MSLPALSDDDKEHVSTKEAAVEFTTSMALTKCVIDPDKDSANDQLEESNVQPPVAFTEEKKCKATAQKAVELSFEVHDDLKKINDKPEKVDQLFEQQTKQIEQGFEQGFEQQSKQIQGISRKFGEWNAVFTNMDIRRHNFVILEADHYFDDEPLGWPVLGTGEFAGRVPDGIKNLPLSKHVTKEMFLKEQEVGPDVLRIVDEAYGDEANIFVDGETGAQEHLRNFLLQMKILDEANIFVDGETGAQEHLRN